MTIIIGIDQVKGGVGASTFAVALALAAAAEGQRVLLAGDEDAAAILGIAYTPEPGMISVHKSGVMLSPGGIPDDEYRDTFDLIITRRWDHPDVERVLLVTSNCYLALRRFLQSDRPQPYGVVLIADERRFLGRDDVADVIGVKVLVEIPWLQGIARMIDAGTFAVRPNDVVRGARSVLQQCLVG